MKIVFLVDTLDNQYAGVYYYTRGLIEALLKHPASPEIILVRHKQGTEGWPVEEIIVPLRKILGHASWRLFFNIPKLINTLNPDWVIEPSHFGPFNLKNGIKRATIIHDITPIIMPDMHVWHSQMLQRRFLPRILKKDDAILVNSVHTAKDLIQWKPDLKDKVHVIYAGCDEVFKPTEKKDVLTPFDIKQPFFLYVGTIEPRKDISSLLKAFTIFKESYQSKIQLVLCGKWGWKNVELLKQLDHHAFREDIVLTGYVDREIIPVLMSDCLAFIYPSLYEGFGLPVLEAMSCGAPVITTKVSSIPEVGGDAALYFNPKDTEALALHMISIAGNEELRTDRKERSLEQSTQYSWSRTADLFLQSLESEEE